MMKLTGCIEWLFADETDDIAERVRLAAAAGLDGVEFHLWRDKPLGDIANAAAEVGLPITSICVDPRRSLVDRVQHREFLDAVAASLEAARILSCDGLIVASGFAVEGESELQQRASMVHALSDAAAMATDHGKVLLLEPLNTRVSHPGMFLSSVEMGLEIAAEVNSPGLRVLYDAFHAAVMDEAPAGALRANAQYLGHVQVADAPGRGAPGTGSIEWRHLASELQRCRFDGPIGLEYALGGLSTRESLAMARATLSAAGFA